jgi:hypothetical protein
MLRAPEGGLGTGSPPGTLGRKEMDPMKGRSLGAPFKPHLIFLFLHYGFPDFFYQIPFHFSVSNSFLEGIREVQV